MKRSSTKEIIICIIAILALILTLTTNVFATTPNLNDLLNNANTNSGYNSIGNNSIGNNSTGNNNIGNNSTGNNSTGNNSIGNNSTGNNSIGNNSTGNNSIGNNSTGNNAKGNNAVIPDAGLDQSVLFIIAIFGISAVYAYKKIRDYNNV